MKYFNEHAILKNLTKRAIIFISVRLRTVIYKFYKASNVKSKRSSKRPSKQERKRVSVQSGVFLTFQSCRWEGKPEKNRVPHEIEKYFEDTREALYPSLRREKRERTRDKTLALVSSQSIILPRTMENAPGPFQPIRIHTEYSVHTPLPGAKGLGAGRIARETSLRPWNPRRSAFGSLWKAPNVLATLPWIYASHGCLLASMLSIRKSIERPPVYGKWGEVGGINLNIAARFFDMLTRIADEDRRMGQENGTSLIVIFFFLYIFHRLFLT